MEDRELVEAMIRDSVNNMFHVYGIEGTEQVIINNTTDKLREQFLKVYNDIVRRGL